MFKSKEIKSLKDDLDKLKNEVYNFYYFLYLYSGKDGLDEKINWFEKRQFRLESKLNMLMDYLGVEEKHEPEKHYIDRRDDE